MKIPIILLIFVMVFGTVFYANSSAILGPAAPMSHESLPQILVQIEVRNSDGVLISYIEPTVFYLTNLYLIHKYLDERESEIVVIDGKSYEQFELEFTFIDRTRSQKASISLWQGIRRLLCKG